MKRIAGITVALLVGVVAPGVAQVSQRLADLQPPKFSIPLCPLQGGGKDASDGQKAVREGAEAKDLAKRQTAFDRAKLNLGAALTKNPSNGAAWYYLARLSLYLGDARGADSAFTKALELNPACELDIDKHRQDNWAQLANQGIQFQQNQMYDSALVLYHQASYLFRRLPHVYINMGAIYANTGVNDSAAVYFAKSVEAARSDTGYTDERNSSMLNLAVVQQRLQRWPDAIKSLHQYREWVPGDMDARRALVSAFRNAGMEDSATTIEQGVLAELASKNVDSLDTQDIMSIGISYFRSKQYADAAAAFAKVSERNPFSRDAVYNLANTYLAMEDYEHLAESAAHLREIDPMNADALQILGRAQKELKQQDGLQHTAEILLGLPFSFEVTGFQMGNTSAKLTADLVGRPAMDLTGKVLPGKPVTLVVEFLDAQGNVVDTQEATVPVLAPDARHNLEVETRVSGVAAWRYHRKES